MSHEFQFIAGDLALEFVNTIGNRLGDAVEYFVHPADVDRWARMAMLLGPRQSLHLTATHVTTLRTVREHLYHVFRPLTLGTRPSAAALTDLNAQLARVSHKRQLACSRDAITWTWRTSPHDPDHILGPVLFSASELLVNGVTPKLRQCDDHACGWLFLDRSQGRRRRWCSMLDCGNRNKARRFASGR